MAEINGGLVAARQLKRAGIDTVFTVLAGPMIEVLAGLQIEGIKVVNCRHEESASFMASAWGYINRKPGVVVAGSGPGMINTVPALYVATQSAMPLVVLGGSFHGATAGVGGFQEADQVAFARPGVKWAEQVDSTERIPELLHLALGKAVSGRPGGVYLDFPSQMVSRKVDEESIRYREAQPAITAPGADRQGVEAVAAMLAGAQRPLILVGKGAAWAEAGAPLTELADMGIPFIGSPMGRGVIPDDHPMCVNAARSSALLHADAILMVGGRFNWMFQFGREPRFAPDVRIAQIDIIAEEMYSSANIEIGLVADCTAATEEIAAALRGSTLRSSASGWADQIRDECRKNEATLAEQIASDRAPIDHYRLVSDLRESLPRDVSISVDGELTMGVARAILANYNPRLLLNSGTTGCMGTGVPYAIGAKLARPDIPSVALVGDYAFGTSMAEVETCARVGANVVFVVSNNAGIAGHSIQDRMFPPDSQPIAALLPAHYEKMAEMVGGFSRRVERPEEIKPAIKDALAANTVAVINVLTDPKGGRRGSIYLG